MSTPSDTPDAALRYARRAINRAATAWVDIKIDHMSVADALYWDATIQRDIILDGIKAKRLGQPFPRADFYWTWTGIRMLFPLAQLLQKRRCRGLTIFVRDDAGRGVPAGMMLLIEKYPWPVPPAAIAQSTFTWFIAAAPSASLISRGVADPPSLGRIMLDTALVSSKALGLDGQMWLHAAPSGGEKPIHFYRTVCHMPSLPRGAALPGGQLSDGRHFYAPVPLARRLIHALQLTR